jgi:glycosyltransferase involved in cell wall biosynthesis
LGKRVIFDAHEDVPKQLLGKPYLKPWLLKILSWLFARFERFVCSRLDGIVTATPSIRDKFEKINTDTTDINNFPLLGELDSNSPWINKASEVCYVGSIATIRGIREVVQALGHFGGAVRLNLVGAFSEPALQQELSEHSGWKHVNFLGVKDRQGVRDVMEQSVAGLVTLHPVINYLDALPIKMFEYMSAGIPVIASDFPLWREIIQSSKCGLLVNPERPKEIAQAINYLLSNPVEAEVMGMNGRASVVSRYNWSVEEKKLLKFYEGLIGSPI